MRSATSIFVIGGLACAVWAGGMATSAEGARVRPVADAAPPAPPAPMVETDADRRDRLNGRMAEMIRAGKRSRLADAPRVVVDRPSTRPVSARAVADRESDRPKAAPSTAPASRRTETSTIAPPAYRGGAIRTSGGRYVAPRLDLTTPPVIPGNDLECLTQAIYYEARNESEQGQAAVAEVVLNRSRSGGYPRKVCDVVYQRNSRTCQFTFTCDGSIGRSPVNLNAWGRAERIAREVYEGRSQTLLPKASVNYHANYVRPSWGRRLARVRQIGAHIFYGAPLGRGTTPGAEDVTPAPEPRGGLIFVRDEALDRAYALMKAGADKGAAKGDDAG